MTIMRKDNIMRTKEHILEYLTQPSHLFLKQVVNIIETNTHILIMDLRKTKRLFIPDNVVRSFETRLRAVKNMAYKTNEYDGVSYVLVPK